MKFKVNDKVELLRDELLDDAYHDKDKTRVAKGTVMEVVHVTPKVCMLKKGVKLEGNDNNPYSLTSNSLTLLTTPVLEPISVMLRK